MKQYEYTIHKNDIYWAVKAINRLPDAYDNKLNGYYKTLTEAELAKLREAKVIR